jgi:hypothetical protein
MATRTNTPVPKEASEQKWLFQWAANSLGKHPELALMFHIPNEGKRSRTTGARMRQEGLKRGVPDIFLPVPRGGFHGLFIEMKRIKGSKTSDDQKGWLEALHRQGYQAFVCKGWCEAADRIEEYLEVKG